MENHNYKKNQNFPIDATNEEAKMIVTDNFSQQE